MSSEDRYYVINGTLVHADYYDEMYHAGVKGMQWGKHLPGTDWWKQTTQGYMNSMPYSKSNKPGVALTKNTLGNKVKANLLTARDAAKSYGHKVNLASRIIGKEAKQKVQRGAYKVAKGTSKLWNEGKGHTKEQINKFKSMSKEAFNGVRNQVHNFFNSVKKEYDHSHIDRYTSLTHLEQWAKKETGEAAHAYVQSVAKGGAGNMINSFIQSAQAKVAVGVNQFLKNIGMTDQVDKFLSKFMGNSARITGQNNKARSQANKTNSGYNRAEANMRSVSGSSSKSITGTKKTSASPSRTSGYDRAESNMQPVSSTPRKKIKGTRNIARTSDSKWIIR